MTLLTVFFSKLPLTIFRKTVNGWASLVYIYIFLCVTIICLSVVDIGTGLGWVCIDFVCYYYVPVSCRHTLTKKFRQSLFLSWDSLNVREFL